MDGVKKFKSLGVFWGIGLVLLGIVFIVFRSDIFKAAGPIIGICMLVIALVKLLQTWLGRKNTSVRPIDLAVGIILAAAGIYILLDSHASLIIIGLVVGIFAFFSAFDRFRVAAARKKNSLKCGSTILFGLIHVVCGIVVVYIAFTAVPMIILLSGIYLLLSGIMVILSIAHFLDY